MRFWAAGCISLYIEQRTYAPAYSRFALIRCASYGSDESVHPHNWAGPILLGMLCRWHIGAPAMGARYGDASIWRGDTSIWRGPAGHLAAGISRAVPALR